MGYLIAILAIGSAAGFRFLLRHFSMWDLPILTFVLPILAVAIFQGLGPALAASALGAFLWVYYFTTVIQFDFAALFTGGVIVSFLVNLLFSLRAQTAVREERLREQGKLIDLAHDAILVRDPESLILGWNAGATAIYGWSESEALGKVTHSLFRTQFPVSCEDVTAKLNRDGFWEGELGHIDRSGGAIVVESRQALLRDDNGNPLRILEINREITARKRAEESMRRSEARFRGLSDANVIGVACGHRGGRIYQANDAFLRIAGYSRDDLQAGKIDCAELWLGSPGPSEMELTRGDGSRIPVLLFTAVPESPEEDAVILIADLSERRMLEEKLRQKQKLETIGLLAAGVAHDFNNLLTAILMNTQLSLESLPDAHPSRRMLEEVIHESQGAAHLVSQLLAYAGKRGLFIRQMDLAPAIRKAIAHVEDSISKQIRVRLELDPGLPPIAGDAGQIQQLVACLLVNAAEAIGEKSGGEIVVSAAACQVGPGNADWIREPDEIEPGAYALLRVRDNGCGMDEATVAKAFDPFFTTKFLGRGLGLSAAQGIARAHRGGIRIASRPVEGTTVETLLPVLARTQEAD